MLDTIILQIPIDYSNIIDPDQFNPSAKMLKISRNFFKCVNNPKSIDKEQGIYKPKLTIIKRGVVIYLKIEFSAPKLLFGNNLDELEENDFNEIMDKLQKVVKEMGVRLWTWQIEKAEVISFHPSKNIILDNNQTASLVIRELRKADFSKRFDLDEKNYRNGGEVLQFRTRPNAFVIYDKIKDLNKRPKRAIDKDQTKYQLSLFDSIKKEKRKIEVIRIEIRLYGKRKINKILEGMNYYPNPLFKDIFKKDLCKKIVNFYWDDFFDKNLFLYAINKNPQEVLKIILAKNPNCRTTKAIQLVGFYQLCKDEEGMKGFRQTIDSYKPKTNWPVIKRDLKIFQDEIFNYPAFGFMKEIKTQLKNFNAFKIKQ